MVEVTEEDERAASTIRRGIGGKYDREHQRNVQAFAAHRTASTAAKDARIAELEAALQNIKAMVTDHSDGEFYPGEPEHVVGAITGVIWAAIP